MTINRDNEFAIIRPVTLADANLTASNIAELAGDDPAAWNAAAPYAVGARASRVGANLHKIFQRKVAGTTPTAPENDSANWVYVKPTNRWCMYDTVNQTQSSNADSIITTMALASVANALVVENVDGNSARLQVAGSPYDTTWMLKSRVCTGWYDYFFEPFLYKKTAVFSNLPPLTTNVLTLTIAKAGGTVKCGTCVPGRRRTFGGLRYGASAGIRDYSTKSTDPFGNVTPVQRAYSKWMNVYVWVPRALIATLHQLFADYRTTPVFWLGAGAQLEPLIVFGYYTDFETAIEYPTECLVRIKIEGLT